MLSAQRTACPSLVGNGREDGPSEVERACQGLRCVGSGASEGPEREGLTGTTFLPTEGSLGNRDKSPVDTPAEPLNPTEPDPEPSFSSELREL